VSVQVKPGFIEKVKKFGAFDISACFNCGTCTAVCPLSKDDTTFPRRIIRYAQIGAEELMISSKELWLCYYCGECSDTCPRQAEPGEFMASARRYAISSFEPLGVARLLYTSKLFTTVFMAFLTIIFGVIMLSKSGPMIFEKPSFFSTDKLQGFIPFEVIHTTGIIVIILAAIAAFVGIGMMTKKVSAGVKLPSREKKESDRGIFARFWSAVKYVIEEMTLENRYRDCEEEPKTPWYRARWFVHWSIMWGFIGLGTATALDYIILLTVGKDPGQPVPLWNPPRLLGTLAGILLVYGTSLALAWRYKKVDKYHSHSLSSDWLFLWLMFLAGITGFALEIAIYLPRGTVWGYMVFLIHVILGMEIVFILPFSKFAHAVYRPLALFIHAFLSDSV